MMEALVRHYETRDRIAIRHICCETADRGKPIGPSFHDRELFADLLTSYYTDYEPQSVWVAEHSGQVIGYVTGCLDSQRYRRITAWRIVPKAMWDAARRGSLWSAPSVRLLWAGFQTWLRGGFRIRHFLRDYPAHVHINLQEGFRGRQVGRQLVERFVEQVRDAGRPGVHASVRGDNPASCRFFERVGFSEVSRRSVTLPVNESYTIRDIIVYGKRC